MSKYIITAFVLILLFIGTSHVFTYQEALENGFSDIRTYYYVAENGFVAKASQEFSQHHLERWGLNVIVGSIAHKFSLDIWAVYRGAVLFCMLVVVFLIHFLNWDDIREVIELV